MVCICVKGVGQLIAGLFAWAFLPNYSCADAATCTYDNNKGWRYVFFASGGLVFIMSILRITVIRLKETPKFLIGAGRDAEAVESLQSIATKYNRPCSLTLEKLTACNALGDGTSSSIPGGGRRGSVSGHARNKWSFGEILIHLKGLYATRRIGLSTSLIWFSWLLIGLAYPLYNVFLPTYLKSRGAAFGDGSQYITWRNYAIVNTCGIFGPILAGYMCATRLGRKYTMVIGALITMVFFFAYTQVRSSSQNLGFNCAISFCLVSDPLCRDCSSCARVRSDQNWLTLNLLVEHLLRNFIRLYSGGKRFDQFHLANLRGAFCWTRKSADIFGRENRSSQVRIVTPATESPSVSTASWVS